MTNRKSTRAFQGAIDGVRRPYVIPESPKGWLKKRFYHHNGCKIAYTFAGERKGTAGPIQFYDPGGFVREGLCQGDYVQEGLCPWIPPWSDHLSMDRSGHASGHYTTTLVCDNRLNSAIHIVDNVQYYPVVLSTIKLWNDISCICAANVHALSLLRTFCSIFFLHSFFFLIPLFQRNLHSLLAVTWELKVLESQNGLQPAGFPRLG